MRQANNHTESAAAAIIFCGLAMFLLFVAWKAVEAFAMFLSEK